MNEHTKKRLLTAAYIAGTLADGLLLNSILSDYNRRIRALEKKSDANKKQHDDRTTATETRMPDDQKEHSETSFPNARCRHKFTDEEKKRLAAGESFTVCGLTKCGKPFSAHIRLNGKSDGIMSEHTVITTAECSEGNQGYTKVIIPAEKDFNDNVPRIMAHLQLMFSSQKTGMDSITHISVQNENKNIVVTIDIVGKGHCREDELLIIISTKDGRGTVMEVTPESIKGKAIKTAMIAYDLYKDKL